MIRRWRSTGYRAAAGSAGSDTDALQTDVMRFMSILGLCLMAVFALVQSLPLQETVPVLPDPEREQLHQAIADQQQRAQALEAELERLLIQLDQAQTHTNVARQALSSAQRELTKVVDATETARSERQRLQADLQSLHQQLERGRHSLAVLQQAADDKTQSLRTLQQRLQVEAQRLDDIRQHARAAAQQQLDERRKKALEEKTRQARVASPPVIEKRPPTPPAPVKKGFTLRFASAEALRRQVAAGSVSLYAMADKQAWRLSLRNGRPVFSDASFPNWFHEMAASTVPLEYVRTLKSSIDRSTSTGVVWGVQLPAATKRGITSLTRSRQGGDLVIAADGNVTLAAE